MNEISVSPRLALLAESLTVAVDMKIKARAAEGHDIVNLGVGQPDFPTPPAIREAAAKAVEAGATRYTPPGGLSEVREAAAEYLRSHSGVPATGANTIITCGAKHGLFEAMTAVLVPGSEVLLPVPYWVTYPEQVKLAGGNPISVVPETGVKVTVADLENVRTPRTRALVLNSPNNPSGAVYSPAEVEALADWCLSNDVIIISDEIYDRLVYDGVRTISPASLGGELASRTITINGVSKAFAMTGWRIGTLTAPSEVVAAVVKFQGQTTGNPAAVSQAAALAAFRTGDDVVESMREAYERRRNLTVGALNQIPGVELELPEGAFYAFPRVTKAVQAVRGSVALAEHLVSAGVGVVPGAGFGADNHIRISFAIAEDRLAEGIRRFKAGLEQLQT